MIKRSECTCRCHEPGSALIHAFPCCEPDAQTARWQPIETAPEHVPILVWVPSINRGHDSAEVVIIIRSADDPSGRGYSMWTNGGPNGGVDVDFEHDPTHWMPVPAGPKREAARVRSIGTTTGNFTTDEVNHVHGVHMQADGSWKKSNCPTCGYDYDESEFGMPPRKSHSDEPVEVKVTWPGPSGSRIWNMGVAGGSAFHPTKWRDGSDGGA